MLHQFHRKLLDKKLPDLCDRMDPKKVANEMLKGRSFTISDYEKVVHPPTSLEKNEELVNILQKKELRCLTDFLRSLSSIDENHLALAEDVQPVNYRLLWISTSPSHAASVVYALENRENRENGANAAFSKMKRVGKDKMLILRRARVFRKEYTNEELRVVEADGIKLVSRCHEFEVCLIFPASSKQDLAGTIEAVFKEHLVPKVNFVVLGKLSDLDREGGASYLVSDVVTVDKGEELRAGPVEIPPQVKEMDGVKIGVMQSKSYRKSQETEASAGPDTDVLDFDSMVLNFYVMCRHYASEAQSLACVTPMPSGACAGGSDSEAAKKNSRTLMNIVEYYYDQWTKTGRS